MTHHQQRVLRNLLTLKNNVKNVTLLIDTRVLIVMLIASLYLLMSVVTLSVIVQQCINKLKIGLKCQRSLVGNS